MITEPLIATKILVAWAAVPITATILAAMESHKEAGIIYLTGLIISSVTAIAVAWIGLKVRQLEKNTNGINTKLNEVTAAKNLAEGTAIGIVQAENKAAVIAVAKAEGVAEEVAKQAVVK